MTRTCPRCQKTQPLDAFRVTGPPKRDGERHRRTTCRLCEGEAYRAGRDGKRGLAYAHRDSVGKGHDGWGITGPWALDTSAEIRCVLKHHDLIAIGRCHAMQRDGSCPRICARFAAIAAEAVRAEAVK